MHVVLLDTRYELRAFPFASASPAFMLPVLHQRLIRRTIEWLGRYRLKRISLVTREDPGEDADLFQAILDHGLETAGSVAEVLHRAKGRGELDQALLVLQANLHPLPKLSDLAAAHQRSNNAVTFLKGSSRFGPGQYSMGPPAAVLAAPSVARLTLQADFQRPLVELPALARRRGLKVSGVELGQGTVEINNPFALWQANLSELRFDNPTLTRGGYRRLGEQLFAAPDARVGDVTVDPDGGIVLVGPGAVIGDGSVLRGPTLVGDNAVVEDRCCVHGALVLADTHLASESFVARSVVGPTLLQRVG